MTGDHLPPEFLASLFEQPTKPATPPDEEPSPTTPAAPDERKYDATDLPIGGDPHNPDAVAYDDWYADRTWSIKAPEDW